MRTILIGALISRNGTYSCAPTSSADLLFAAVSATGGIGGNKGATAAGRAGVARRTVGGRHGHGGQQVVVTEEAGSPVALHLQVIC